MSIGSIAAVAAYSPASNFIASPDGSTVTVMRDQNQQIVSIEATPATFPASAVALASNQATGTTATGIHILA